MLDNLPRLAPRFLAAVGMGALGMAYVAEYVFGLEPCILCLYQRIPYALVAILGFSTMMRPGLLKPVLALAALTFAVGCAVAVYHVGVEQHWWVSAAGCTGDIGAQVSSADLLKSMQSKPPKPCDAVDWTVLGVSMAGWNSVVSFLAAGACLYALARIAKSRSEMEG